MTERTEQNQPSKVKDKKITTNQTKKKPNKSGIKMRKKCKKTKPAGLV